MLIVVGKYVNERYQVDSYVDVQIDDKDKACEAAFRLVHRRPSKDYNERAHLAMVVEVKKVSADMAQGLLMLQG